VSQGQSEIQRQSESAAPTEVRSSGLTFRDGGWVLALAGALCLALVAWAMSGVVAGHIPIGGGDVASYKFDLSHATIPAEELVPTGQPRDFMRPLIVGETMTVADMPRFNAENRRYLVSGDRVVGVRIGDAVRAYPIAVLNGHEVVEDVLGGVPILVAYSPPSDAAAVFDRRIGERTLSFGLSGLVRAANSVLYDVGSETPSLWQQATGEAIAGPAAERGERLRPIPEVFITTWADFAAAFPSADLPRRNDELRRRYQRISWERAHQAPEIGFPLPRPTDPTLPVKSPVLVVDAGGERFAIALERVRARAGDRPWTIEFGGAVLEIAPHPGHRTAARVSVRSGTVDAIRPMFWFAADALLRTDPSTPLRVVPSS
jgi:hypothetical protein